MEYDYPLIKTAVPPFNSYTETLDQDHLVLATWRWAAVNPQRFVNARCIIKRPSRKHDGTWEYTLVQDHTPGAEILLRHGAGFETSASAEAHALKVAQELAAGHKWAADLEEV